MANILDFPMRMAGLNFINGWMCFWRAISIRRHPARTVGGSRSTALGTSKDVCKLILRRAKLNGNGAGFSETQRPSTTFIFLCWPRLRNWGAFNQPGIVPRSGSFPNKILWLKIWE